MSHIPVELKRRDRDVLISWSDGSCRRYTPGLLRASCPCALCKEKERAVKPQVLTVLPVLTIQETLPLEISTMQPVGNYAYNIQFSDGHHAGIFEFAFLHSIGLADDQA
jgi:DUF971 family protein